MKRVLLVVVDGCTPRVLGPAMDRGDLPLLADLAARGTLALDGVSIFPSITPAATASIVTGRYPAQHGIGGMSWWDPASDHVFYFGDDVRTVLRRGIGAFLRDFLLQLNGDRLRSPTMFQLVERAERRAACFNHLIFRGDVCHAIVPPLLLRLLPSVDARIEVQGPSWLCLGDFVASSGRGRPDDADGGPLHRFGLDDQGTEAFLRQVPDAGALPDFSLAYFPDYDFDSHEHGPGGALGTLRRLDERLRAVVDAWGGLDRVLDDTAIVLTADHSHSDLPGGNGAGIVLHEVLADYDIAGPAEGSADVRGLLVCPNMRTAEIYTHDGSSAAVDALAAALCQDPRVDQVIWRASRDHAEFHVATRDRGRLRFGTSLEGSAAADEYGGRWSLHGDLETIDASLERGRIRYGVYPNALERIACGVAAPRRGLVWVTARPGYEFSLPGQDVHAGGGSHGTLHELDSRVPVIVAGTGAPLPLERGVAPRIVDVAAICLGILGMGDAAPVPAGAAHR